jgi:Ca2+-binding RTX toxin-like protein
MGTRRSTTTIVLAGLVMTSTFLPVATASGAAAAASCRGVPATIVGTAADDLLMGTPGPDVMVGLEGDDILFGVDGDDRICGGTGSDRLGGGVGDDKLFGEKDGFDYATGGLAGDALWGGPGDDVLNPGRGGKPTDYWGIFDQLRFSGSSVGVRVDLGTGVATGEGTDRLVVTAPVTVVGTPYDDVILGSGRTDRIVMLTGHDVVDGRGGADTIWASDRETVTDRIGDDVRGGFGNDYIVAGLGDDLVRGDGGADTLVDPGGVVHLAGGPGNDSLTAAVPWTKSGHRIDGGPGRDFVGWSLRLRADDRGDVRGVVDLVLGSMSIRWGDRATEMSVPSLEAVALPPGRWRVTGGPANERVSATYHRTSRLVARMGAGNDRVYGSGGDDLLSGGPGFDRVGWSRGVDVCSGFEVGTRAGCEVAEDVRRRPAG